MPTKIDRVKLEYTLTFTTLFHCGTGMRAGLVDRAVKRDHAGYLYVPGSTFKGVLREHCEQLALFYASEAIASPHEAEAALDDLGLGLGKRQPSMVTRLFGSQNVPGRLFFDDARLGPEEQGQYMRPGSADERKDGPTNRRDYKGLQVNLYTQVRLDRPTHTAVPGALYTSEFGARAITFAGCIQGGLECTALPIAALQNTRYPAQTPTYSLLLLLAGLRLVERLGGNKSTGKGHCACEITTLQMNGHTIGMEVWTNWLEQLDELARYDQLQEGRA